MGDGMDGVDSWWQTYEPGGEPVGRAFKAKSASAARKGVIEEAAHDMDKTEAQTRRLLAGFYVRAVEP